MKLTEKQEKFCAAYIETGNASEAYRRAYNATKMRPETISRNAKALMDNSKIATRLAELRKPVIEAAQITLESHLKRLDDLSKAAEEQGQYSAAINAEVARGKAAGIHVEKSEQLVTTRELPASVDDFL